MAGNSINAVKMRYRQKVLTTISKLRKKRLSYSKIGFMLDLHKSAVYLIEKRKWYPKMHDVENRILTKIQELEL